MAHLTGYPTVEALAFTQLHDTEFTGNGIVSGTTMLKGTPSNLPVARRVRLIRQVDGYCVDETWSDPVSGAFEFHHVKKEYLYTVLTYDHVGTDRAVVADGVIPV